MLDKPVCPSRSARAGRKASALLSLLALVLFGVIPSCSLGNIDAGSCADNNECVVTIGPGSSCANGYCTDPLACATGHDCRKAGGGGACVSGFCVSTFPTDPQCMELREPANLLDARLAGPDAPLVIGSIYSLGELKDQVLSESVRLVVDEINNNGKMNRGKSLGVVVCDNGGPGNKAQGADRATLTNKAVDYLAGTLGVPYIVGPLSSADSLLVIARLKEKNYPTVVISASSTSPSLTDADDPLNNGKPGLFWRTCPSDLLQGQVMADSVIEMDPTVTKVAVIYSNDSYGQGLSQVFRDNFTPPSEIFPVNDAQYNDPAAMTALANQVNAYAPNAVLVITVRAGDTLTILKALADTAAGNVKYFFTDGAKDADAMFAADLPAKVKTIIAGSRGTAPASFSDNAAYEIFRANFKSKFQRDPSGFSFTAHAYDATYVGAYGVIWASRESDNYDGNNVTEGMLKLSMGPDIQINFGDWTSAVTTLGTGASINVRGASGDLQFNPDTGEAPGAIEIWKVVNGNFAPDGTPIIP